VHVAINTPWNSQKVPPKTSSSTAEQITKSGRITSITGSTRYRHVSLGFSSRSYRLISARWVLAMALRCSPMSRFLIPFNIREALSAESLRLIPPGLSRVNTAGAELRSRPKRQT
jgi:hypothetical protein